MVTFPGEVMLMALWSDTIFPIVLHFKIVTKSGCANFRCKCNGTNKKSITARATLFKWSGCQGRCSLVVLCALRSSRWILLYPSRHSVSVCLCLCLRESHMHVFMYFMLICECIYAHARGCVSRHWLHLCWTGRAGGGCLHWVEWRASHPWPVLGPACWGGAKQHCHTLNNREPAQSSPLSSLSLCHSLGLPISHHWRKAARPVCIPHTTKYGQFDSGTGHNLTTNWSFRVVYKMREQFKLNH